jgi:RNA recognition motif-containing protein
VRLFVKNLPFSATKPAIAEFFRDFGRVCDIHLPYDFEHDHPRGYCFIEVEPDDAARLIMAKLNGADFGGRPIEIKPATPRRPRHE